MYQGPLNTSEDNRTIIFIGMAKRRPCMLDGGAPLIEVSFYTIYNKFWDFDNWVFNRGCALNRWPLKGGTTIFMVVWVPLGFVVYCLSHNSHYTVDNFAWFYLYSWFSSGTLFNLDIKKGHGTDKINTLSQQGYIIHWCIDIHFQLGQRWRIHCYSVEDSVKNPHNVLYNYLLTLMHTC